MEPNTWIIDVNESVKNMGNTLMELQLWRKRSIYRLPDRIIHLDNNACKPVVVSFGPYHHGEQQLKPMEEHKSRALVHFLKRSEKPLEYYVEALNEEVNYLKDKYDQLDPEWQQDTTFLQLMIRDGCFLLEILRVATSFSGYARNDSQFEYPPNDPIFSNHGNLYAMPLIRRDMLLLENQVPLRVLEILFTFDSIKIKNPDESSDERLSMLIQNFFHPEVRPLRMKSCLHVLDVYRKSLVIEVASSRRKRIWRRRYRFHVGDGGVVPSAAELHEAGVRFRRSTTMSLKDIRFQGSTLRLPQLVVDDNTISIFLHMIAFERFHVDTGNEVTSYAFFMGSLLRSTKDVSILRSRGIIRNGLRNDEAVAILFDLISKDLVLAPESRVDDVIKMVSEKLRSRFRKRLNAWRTDLVQTYFKSPWAAVSIFAAILLFTLTIIQTVYTVLSYTHPKK